MNLDFALFPGCVASVREIGFELSARNVSRRVGIQLQDVDGFSCCMPACLVHSVDYVTGLALSIRNICIAEREELDLFTLCSSCFGNLSRAKHLMDRNRELRSDVEKTLRKIDMEYKGMARVEHLITVLHDRISPRGLSSLLVRQLGNLKVAAFYGCHIFLPNKYTRFDNPEFPESLDHLIQATGAASIAYEGRTNCCIGCGTFFGGVSEQASIRLANDIVGSASRRGADCIVTTCPFCVMQLELGQLGMAEMGEEAHKMPVLHYVDLLGLSLGMSDRDLGLNLKRIDLTPVLAKIGM